MCKINKKNYLRTLIILSLPMLFYLIPLFLGYAWNVKAIVPGSGVFFNDPNMYNQPEIYTGRHPKGSIMIDAQTPSTYNLPYDVNLRRYVLNGHLPLWNPNKGIGVPFSSLGEGSPYFPLGILRALLPRIYANYITFFGFYYAGVFIFFFLRNMAISVTTAFIGSFSFVLSGALCGQIPQTNIVSSLSVVPFLFWASTKAIRVQTPLWRGILSVAVALQILAGHITMAFVILISTAIFILYYVWLKTNTLSCRIRESVIIMSYFMLGVGLSSFLIFPVVETLNVAYHPGHKNIGSYYLPISHLLTIFYPYLFGPIHKGWFHINWFDLYAFIGLSVVVSILGGISVSSWNNRLQRLMFWFFVLAGLFWILRYVGFPPLSWIGMLPLFSTLSPKHANGFTIFCLCMASAFAIDNINKWKLSWFLSIFVIVFIAAASIFILIVSKTGFANINTGFPFIIISVILTVSTASVFVYAIRLSSISDKNLEKAKYFLLFAVPAELSIYIPLGNSSVWFLLFRLLLYAFILFTAIIVIKMPLSLHLNSKYTDRFTVLIKLSKHYRFLVISMMGAISVIGYALLIHIPHHGLSKQYDTTLAPKQLVWLKNRMSFGDRSFGIRPEYQSLANIQNIDTTGPFQPHGFANFINLIEGNVTHVQRARFKNGDFEMNLSEYNMTKYLRHKHFFDWVGVKYLFLEKSVFDTRKDEFVKLSEPLNGLNIVYDDSAVTIMESPTALGRAYFSSDYTVFPKGPTSTEAILQFFKTHPNCITKTTVIEDSALNNISSDLTIKCEAMMTQIPVEINKYEPNYIRLRVDAPSSGIVVLKDAFYPGWRAYVDNVNVPLLRANAMVRAIKIDSPGKYVVEFKYLPNSFIYGVLLSVAVLIFLSLSVLIKRPKPQAE